MFDIDCTEPTAVKQQLLLGYGNTNGQTISRNAVQHNTRTSSNYNINFLSLVIIMIVFTNNYFRQWRMVASDCIELFLFYIFYISI